MDYAMFQINSQEKYSYGSPYYFNKVISIQRLRTIDSI